MKPKQSTGVWVLGGLVVAVVIAALAWFLLISPEIDKASDASAAAEAARDANDLLELQIQQMQALEKDVPDWRDQIAKVAMDMPPTPEAEEVIRLVTSHLEAAGLPVVQLSVAKAATVNPLALSEVTLPTLADESDTAAEGDSEASAADAESTPAEEGAAGEGEGSETAAAGAAGTVELPFTGLEGMTVAFSTEGDHGAILDALRSLYDQKDRFFTVTGLTVQRASETDEQPGRPALAVDQWTVSVTGLVFSLVDEELSYPTDEDGEAPTYAAGDRAPNALEPLAG
ncbi:hypothetical protein [Demequina mangrovi]|uniref:Type IV pilus assembly protein PilO n=1 Tax=Demequina mangrovi TaxID=1043493 RepID=A0A1H6UDS9_9MICO|nr:hypothetical protein [Demequina mangrovi]SEI86325.1 hypothetical protein SAMN05421637_0226 [Demequina mangrovi]